MTNSLNLVFSQSHLASRINRGREWLEVFWGYIHTVYICSSYLFVFLHVCCSHMKTELFTWEINKKILLIKEDTRIRLGNLVMF